MSSTKSLEEVQDKVRRSSMLIKKIEKQERLILRISMFQNLSDPEIRLYSIDRGGLDMSLDKETERVVLKVVKARMETNKHKLTRELDKLMGV